jgi:spore germination protein GerM
LYQSELSVQGIGIEEGVATINLTGTIQTGGVCDAPRIEAQIEQTALQFVTIQSVNILINGQPLAAVTQ